MSSLKFAHHLELGYIPLLVDALRTFVARTVFVSIQLSTTVVLCTFYEIDIKVWSFPLLLAWSCLSAGVHHHSAVSKICGRTLMYFYVTTPKWILVETSSAIRIV